MPEPLRVAILTTGRQDAGILRSVVLALREDSRFAPRLWAGGMHLQARFGNTVEQLRASMGAPDRRIGFVSEPPLAGPDNGRAVTEIHAALAEERPDALLVVGDRSETLAAAFAATLARVPVIHLHGGEETEGAMDNAFRHAITKLSHLHLVSHADHARRVVQMGEDPARVVVIGAPGLDNLLRDDLPTRDELSASLGFPLEDPVIVVTVHPTTLADDPLADARAVSAALEGVEGTIILTAPNADSGGEAIRHHWQEWSNGRPAVHLIDSLGELRYWALLRLASLVVGNSSSGLIEAPAAGVAAINVGDRQKGRLRGVGVIDVPSDGGAVAAVARARLDEALDGRRAATSSPYPAGSAAKRAVAAIAAWAPRRREPKRFTTN